MGRAAARALHTAPTPATPADEAPKNIDDVVKGFDKLDGALTLYRKKNDLYAEIKPEQLDKPFLLQATRETGTAGVGGTAGDPLADIVFRFQKTNDQIYLVEPNITFRADQIPRRRCPSNDPSRKGTCRVEYRGDPARSRQAKDIDALRSTRPSRRRSKGCHRLSDPHPDPVHDRRPGLHAGTARIHH